MEARSEWFTGAEDCLSGYQVYDRHGENIGKVDDLFVDDLNDQLEYISVKTGFSGLRSILIPTDVVRIDGERQLIEISEAKDKVKDAPNFEDLEEITAEFEWEVRSYFDLCALEAAAAEPTDGATGALLEHHR
jgi:sporulation protein YlmC with PRC-barrel domain